MRQTTVYVKDSYTTVSNSAACVGLVVKMHQSAGGINVAHNK